MRRTTGATLLASVLLGGTVLARQPTHPAVDYDLIIRNGTVFDGSGGAGVRADVGIIGDRIVTIGDLKQAHAAPRGTRPASTSRPASSASMTTRRPKTMRSPRGC